MGKGQRVYTSSHEGLQGAWAHPHLLGEGAEAAVLRIMGRGLGAGVGFGPGYVCFRACAFPTQQKLGFREGGTQLLAPAQPSSADSHLHTAGSERTWPYLITDWW